MGKSGWDYLVERIAKVLPDWAIWIILSVTAVCAIALGALIVAAVRRVWIGDEVSILKIFVFRPNRRNTALAAEVEKAQRDAQKLVAQSQAAHLVLRAASDVLSYMNDSLRGDLTLSPGLFARQYCSVALNALLRGLGDSAANHIRVALFMPDQQVPSALRMFPDASVGFTTVHTERLPISGSAAGWVFATGRMYQNQQVSKQRDGVFRVRAEGDCPYESLICVPVKLGERVIATLCVDAERPHSFTEEHVLYATGCATLLATLFAHLGEAGVREVLAAGTLEGG